MLLLSHWKKTLSVGMLAATGAGIAHAQAPGNMGLMRGQAMPVSYSGQVNGNYAMPMGGMAPDYGSDGCSTCEGSCDGSCEPGCDSYCEDACDSCGDGCDGLGLMGSGRLFRGRNLCAEPMAGPGCEDFAQLDGGRLHCNHCGYAGCARCGWGVGLLIGSKFKGLGRGLLPYGEGGVATQRWYDFSAEAIAFRRTLGADPFNYSSQGTGTNNIVLNNSNVDLDQYRFGMQVMAAFQTGVAANIEGVYFGLNSWDRDAVANSTPANTPTLFSFISNFGTNPINGFDDPDRSFQHSLNYKSALHNFELNFRRRWIGPYGWFQGSWMSGVRYFDLDESLTFAARGENNDTFASNGLRFFNYNTQTRNQLTGFQIGGDLWANVIPGVKLGLESKGGVFGNHSEQGTRITANSIANLQESISDGRTAYIGQVAASALYRLSHSWTLKGSYHVMYIDNVALAPNNINAAPPALFLPNSQRVVSINNRSDVRYEGFSFGAEYIW